jgi:hypothetical protein
MTRGFWQFVESFVGGPSGSAKMQQQLEIHSFLDLATHRKTVDADRTGRMRWIGPGAMPRYVGRLYASVRAHANERSPRAIHL